MGLRKGEAGITKGGGLLKNVVVVDVGGCGSAEEGLTLKKDTSDRDATKKWGGGQQLRKCMGLEGRGTLKRCQFRFNSSFSPAHLSSKTGFVRLG